MKKIVLFLFLLFAVILKSQAQNTFAPVGAEWWYGGDNYDFSNNSALLDSMYNATWTDHVLVEKDTVIVGKNCRKLTVTRNQKNGTGYINATETHYSNIFVYDNPDSVYVYNERAQEFTPLYVYNTIVGDTVTLATFNTLFNCKDSFSYVLDSVKMETYDNESLETFYTHVIDTVSLNVSLNWGRANFMGDGQHWKNVGRFVRKIGGYWGDVSSILPQYSLQVADAYVSSLQPAGNLHCYSDTAMSIKLSTIACDSVNNPVTKTVVAIHDIAASNLQLTLSPNPASTQINIQSKLAFENNSWMAATDVLGRVMMQPLQLDKKKNVSVDISNWANGIYLIRIQLGNQAYYQKISVQH